MKGRLITTALMALCMICLTATVETRWAGVLTICHLFAVLLMCLILTTDLLKIVFGLQMNTCFMSQC